MRRSRRATITASGTVLAAVAGCTTAYRTDSGPTGETEIVETRVESGNEVSASGEDPPVVDYDPEAREIRIAGVFPIGNRCYDERIGEPSYDPDADELSVRIERTHDGGDACEDVLQMTSYLIVVEFTGRPPATVVATEAGAFGTEETREELR